MRPRLNENDIFIYTIQHNLLRIEMSALQTRQTVVIVFGSGYLFYINNL